MTTARDIIESASRKIHVLGRGQTLSSEEAQDALDSLNAMLSSWSVEGGLVFADVQESFPLTSSTTYSIGSGGDFDTTVPYRINNMYVSQGGLDYFLESISLDQYNAISLKDTGSRPYYYYFDYGYPLCNISLYYKPDSSYTLTINSKKRLDEFDSLTSNFTLPPEYKEALVYNLAIRLAPDYEKEPSMAVVKIADESKNNVFSANTLNDESVSTPAYYGIRHGGRTNIYDGNN